MKKYIFLLLFACCLIFNIQAQNKIELFSPNGEIKVSIRLSDKIYYDVSCSNEKVLENNSLMLALKEQVLGEHPKLSGQKRKSVKETLTPIVPLKFASIDNEYNQLLLNFRDNYSVEFRAFNDGIAYRFITRFKKDIEVIGEDFSLQLPLNIYFTYSNLKVLKLVTKSFIHIFPVPLGNHRIGCLYSPY